MNVLFIGAPGSGKGTQSRTLCEKFKFIQLSTGDILRDSIVSGDSIGLEAKKLMDKGMLVPDDIISKLVEAWIVKKNSQEKANIIFDGFPRTVNQVNELTKILSKINLKIDYVFYFKTNDILLIDRLTGRRTCSKCGEIYHLTTKPSKVDGICDLCGGELKHRSDDRKEVIEERLVQYYNNTRPVIDLYKNSGVFVELDAMIDPDNLFKNISKLLKLNN